MNLSSSKKAVVIVLLLTLGAAATIAISLVRDKLRGNYSIAFYGRLIDDVGKPVGGARIDVRVVYATGAGLPVMYGRGEGVNQFSVYTDSSGVFHFGNVSGHGLRLRSFSNGISDLILAGSPPWPPTQWNLDDPAERATLPARPDRPLTYKVVPKGSGK